MALLCASLVYFCRKITLNELLIDAPKDALDLVKSLLVLDPIGRLTAKQALDHPYLEKCVRLHLCDYELLYLVFITFITIKVSKLRT